MEQQPSEQKILDPIERAKLGLKLMNKPYEEAIVIIDDYVSGKNYDKASVDYFKEQLATQIHIIEKGSELLATTGAIAKLVMNAFVQNLPKPSSGNHPGE